MPNSLGKFAIIYNISTGETSLDKPVCRMPALPAACLPVGRVNRVGRSELFPSDLNLKIRLIYPPMVEATSETGRRTSIIR